jgi:hypothetical protein
VGRYFSSRIGCADLVARIGRARIRSFTLIVVGGSPNPLPSGGAIDFVFALIFPKQHPDKLVLPSLEVPRWLLRYTSNPHDYLWSDEVLSVGRCEHKILERHFSSISNSGWRSIVVNKTTYKGTCLYNFPEEGL